MMDEKSAAHMVYDCMLDFGTQESNPVLSVIDTGEPFQSGRHYPDPYLTFNSQGLRAYYHSHPHPGMGDEEHGHFHIFAATQGDGESWTHIAALGMDRQGQANKWLSTNRWVTDEYWLAADSQRALSLSHIDVSELKLVEQWIYAMLMLYQPELEQLWQQRDQYLNNIKAASKENDVFEDREHYLLAEQHVALMDKLQKILQI